MSQAPEDFRGLVLARFNYKESDLLVKMLTDHFGKRMFLFRRARKPGFKMTAAVLPFTLSNFTGRINAPGLSYVQAVRGSHAFTKISADLTLNAYSSYILALIDMAFDEDTPIPEWFRFAEQALTLIDQGTDPQIVTNIAEIQLLPAFGVGPNWRGCSVCGRNDLPLDFSDKYGGLLCSDHWQLDERRYHASERAIYYLRLFSHVDIATVGKVAVSEQTRRELRTMIDRMYDGLVGVQPKAKRFLDELNGAGSHIQALKPRKPKNSPSDFSE
ncbi:DNA repair protein RecO [Lacticaseibacillus pabuli]|uniref:DNA repair protein RecO n=1 Tax=Lacticaseibacillus pabuli TaxID=3025672 RepID=A0ABY7WUF8_9LACO|nr:DNA repair protein RecO [Lacticaseibacillus sp. KACC 23028]WDF83790.1 DNA repair protein RecO [Lacticaseibacillus sp. KACC 23028]